MTLIVKAGGVTLLVDESVAGGRSHDLKVVLVHGWPCLGTQLLDTA